MLLNELGNKKSEVCYDGKTHETTCTDYLVEVAGNTYHNRDFLHSIGMSYLDCNKHTWAKNITTEKELEEIKNAIQDKNICIVNIKPVYRITG